MANIITSCRILCSIALLLFPVFTPGFYILYFIGGFTDMIDGIVARKTNTVSEYGSRLDTVADFIFVVACMFKLLPGMDIPIWLWTWIAIIFAIKIINIATGVIIKKRFVAEHTIMNKITGMMLFIIPFTLYFVNLKYSTIVVCVVATFAALQERYIIRYENELH